MNRITKKLIITSVVLGSCVLILFPTLKNKLLNDIKYLKSLLLKKMDLESNITLNYVLQKAKEFESNISNNNEIDSNINIENAVNFYIFALEKFNNFNLKEFQDLCTNQFVKEKVLNYLNSQPESNNI